jgi:glycosyltransferase involved in cell wall biosynthesis
MPNAVDRSSLAGEAGFALAALARALYERLPDRLRRPLGQRLRGEPVGQAAPAGLPAPRAGPFRHGAVLVLDAHTPRLTQDAASLATVELLGAVAELGYQPRFAAVEGAPYLPEHTEALRRRGVLTLHPPDQPSLARYLAAGAADIAAVIVVRHGVARRWLPRLRRLLPGRPILFLDADLHYLRERRRAELAGSRVLKLAAGMTRRQELAVVAAADATIVHSSVEAALIEADAPGARLAVWVWPVEPKPTPAPFAARQGLLFLGGYRHPPNLDGARWLVESVLPLLRPRLPGLGVRLVGSNAGAAIGALAEADVTVVGAVADLAPEFSRARVFVAPLRYGAGLKGKVLEAAAYGVPMVLTSVAAEGTGFEPDRHVLIADGAPAFAEAILRLHEDAALWSRLRQAALEKLEDTFSRVEQTARLARLFDQLNLPVN